MNRHGYAEYQDSGVAWLGRIPRSWDAGPLKRWIEQIESGTSVNASDVPAKESEIGVLKTSCVFSGEFDISQNKTVAPEEVDRTSCPVREGTLIVSRMNTPDLVGAAGYVSVVRAGIFLPDRLWQITFRGLSSQWVGYWSKTSIYRDQLKSMSVGTSSSMQNISQSDFGSIVIPVPSDADQKVIVDFLNLETAKLDALIAKQEQLIATLREDRAAMITQAVTVGLDSGVEMRETDERFIKQIPKHWLLSRLARVLTDIIDCAHSTPNLVEDGGFTVVRTSSIRNGGYRPGGSFPTDIGTYRERTVRGAPTPGDIFFTREAPAGEACMVPDDETFCLGQRMVLLKPDHRTVVAKFIVYTIYAHPTQAYFAIQTNGSTVANLVMDKISKIPLSLPPLVEQAAIVQFLDDRCDKVDALIAKSTEVIETLREFRSTLITSAVTGTIDVREVA